MAKVPIEIVRIGNSFRKEIEEVVSLVDKVQTQFDICLMPPVDEVKFQLLAFKQADIHELLDKLKRIRSELKGFHPFVVAICNIDLSESDRPDVCGECHQQDGIAVFSFRHIAGEIIPIDKIKAYIAFYIARFTFNFLNPQHRNHEKITGCVFDANSSKMDLICRITTGVICDCCRAAVLSNDYSMSASQFTCLSNIFKKAEELYDNDIQEVEQRSKRPKIFIGSSSEGVEIARKVQTELSDFDVVIWNQGIFKMGLSYLESLEDAVASFDYGIFIFNPDDTIESRGETKKTARDNVIFELGMFIGKLSRRKAFFIFPNNSDMHILSDLSGITSGGYDPRTSNLQAAIGPVCEQIRTTIKTGFF